MALIQGLPDWVIYYMIVQYVGLAVVGVYILWNSRLKIFNCANFYRRASEVGKRFAPVVSDKVGVGVPSAVRSVVVSMKPDDVVKGGSPAPVKISDKAGDYVWVGSKEFSSKSDFVKFGRRNFEVDLARPFCRKFGGTYYAYDYDENRLLWFGGQEVVLDPDVADRHLENGIWQRILMGAGLAKWILYIIIAVVVVVGVCAGVGGYFAGQSAGWQSGFDFANKTLTAKPLVVFG